MLRIDLLIKRIFLLFILVISAPLSAANYALIMWIGAYPADAKLPGIHLDAVMAKKLANMMGVPPSNVTEVSNQNLTAKAFGSTLESFQQKIRSGDKVFIYYSGHGAQVNSGLGPKCSESMVGVDLVPFPDFYLEKYLQNIANKAKQVVMFNDSCFSGGQATRSLDDPDDFEIKSKSLNTVLSIEDKSNTSNYQCGESINSRVGKALEQPSQNYGTNFLYVAASSDKEVSFATSMGSAATLAWTSCLNAKSDTDKSGMLNGLELQACAQSYLNGNNQYRKKFNQNISLIGNKQLPLIFTSDTTSPSQTVTTPDVPQQNLSTAATTTRPSAQTSAPVSPMVRQETRAPATFADLKAMSNPTIRVRLELLKNRLKIGQDFLEMRLSHYREAYVYLFYASASNSSIDLLFPNPRANQNKLKSGTYLLPSPDWSLRSAGPAGDGTIIALTSYQSIPFAVNKGSDSFETTTLGVKQFFELIEAQPDSEIGVSQLTKVTEY